MLRSLIARRDAAADRHDLALARHPTRQGAAFVAELEAVIAELEAVADEAKPETRDRVEYARTLSWIGSAYFDLGAGKDLAALSRSEQCYLLAEQALPTDDDSITRAKIAFNYANTLRGQSQGTNRALLEAAQERYELAMRIFKREGLSDLAAQAQEHLTTLRSQLTLARAYGDMSREAHPNPHLVQQALSDLLGDMRQAVAAHPERFEAGDESLRVLEAQESKLDATLSNLGQVDPSQAAIVEALQSRLRSEVGSGAVTPERARALESLMQRLGGALARPGESIDALSSQAEILRALAKDAMDTALRPSYGGPPPPQGSRSASLRALLGPVRRYLLSQSAAQTGGNNQGIRELFVRAAELDTELYRQAATDPEAHELEPRAWALARDVRRFARAAHAMVATPRWPARSRHEDARAVVLSGLGPPGLRRALLEQSQIHWLVEPERGERATERYAQLRSADLGVFFLDSAPDEGQKDSSGARVRLANTCYELGLALTLGIAPVVVVQEDAAVPFDVPVEVVRVKTDTPPAALIEAVEHVAFNLLWGGSSSWTSTAAKRTLDFVTRSYAHRAANEAAIALRVAAESTHAHPSEFADRLQRFLSYCDGPELLYPAWPPEYPNEPRCFHVTPFRDWSRPVRDVVEACCRERGVAYSRGDETDEQAIIAAIWSEISRASHVLVDLTNLNPNVALELGIANGLGKRCRLVFNEAVDVDERITQIFPAIAKDQRHAYSPADDYAVLRRQVAQLLQREVDSHRT